MPRRKPPLAPAPLNTPCNRVLYEHVAYVRGLTDLCEQRTAATLASLRELLTCWHGAPHTERLPLEIAALADAADAQAHGLERALAALQAECLAAHSLLARADMTEGVNP